MGVFVSFERGGGCLWVFLGGWVFLTEREFFIDNLMVRIHLIIVKILVDRPCAMGVRIPFSR